MRDVAHIQYMPLDFRGLFDARVPQSLVDCIADLLRWNPAARLTSEQCIDHPYFHETIPHLQRTPPLPQIPFSSGQPPVVPPMERPAALDAPPRSLPPSHSHHTGARPAFANGETRVLPPPVATPENMNRIFLPPGHYRPDASAASALVNQLRELDLPTAELASYGTRQPVRAEETFGQRPAPQASYTEEPKRRQVSGTVYDGSVYEGSNPSIPHIQPQAQSTASFHQQQSPRQEPVHAQSRSSLHHQYTHTTPQQSPSQSNRDSLPSHVTAYVQQQQQQMALSPPQESYAPPPIEQSPVDARPPQPTIGKKKKWGLSSVFGGGDKSASSTSIVGSTSNLLSASTLKRTQSGQHSSDRSPIEAALPPLSDDPKKAKKEAAARAKELAMAQREATARAQQERARAVMQKRNQIVGDRVEGRSKVDLEYGRGDSTGLPTASAPANQSTASLHGRQQPQQQYAASSSRLAPVSTNMGATASTPNFPTQRTYASMPPSASLSSIRSLDSGQSQSTTNQLSAETLSKYDTGSRSKARRRENDYDHSESDHASLRNRSVLSIGTVDSE
jgi:meiosis induction protein kinase IME2/SME1